MTPTEIARVQQYLRQMFGSDTIKVVPPMRPGLSVELSVKDEIVGTIYKDTEDGEVSFSVTMTILEEDLPAAPAASKGAAPPPRGRR